jgi:selenoprotein W-related protein
MENKAVISFRYCTQCKWMLRTAWMAQEVLSTFDEGIKEVRLIPETGGIFQIQIDDAVVWDRKSDGGFPDIKILKRFAM